MATRHDRLALNQAAFRIANERRSAWPERQDERRGGSSTYFCECSRTDCRDMLRLQPDEYESVRAESRRFVIAPGHEYTEVERVIDDRGRFAVVEKFEEVAPLVES